LAYDADEASAFYDGPTFVSNVDHDVRLYLDGYLTGNEWHGHIVGAPKLMFTRKLLKAIKDLAPPRSGRAHSECHMALTPMTVPLLYREEGTSMLKEQDNKEQSQVRSAAYARKAKYLAPPFSTTVDEFMGWPAICPVNVVWPDV
jgi:hypothetical protein